eukprot:TRINITY_DN5303_c0_g1_i2.p1 TRINITY_DN5303_c0_g1~~TRINITY_DN5303_c0_g1_i2.p1  ORF type:complete len:1419 (+),score=354.76 TRINITY_DN5303_c0_g1_i2:92-4258(+)
MEPCVSPPPHPTSPVSPDGRSSHYDPTSPASEPPVAPEPQPARPPPAKAPSAGALAAAAAVADLVSAIQGKVRDGAVPSREYTTPAHQSEAPAQSRTPPVRQAAAPGRASPDGEFAGRRESRASPDGEFAGRRESLDCLLPRDASRDANPLQGPLQRKASAQGKAPLAPAVLPTAKSPPRETARKAKKETADANALDRQETVPAGWGLGSGATDRDDTIVSTLSVDTDDPGPTLLGPHSPQRPQRSPAHGLARRRSGLSDSARDQATPSTSIISRTTNAFGASFKKEHKAFGSRLGDGLEGHGYTAGLDRLGELHAQMERDTLHRPDYPRPDEGKSVFDWAVSLPDAFREKFTPAERTELGFIYNWREPHCVEFFNEDMIQSPEERRPDGSCRPRTPLVECGLHGYGDLDHCLSEQTCLWAGSTRGAATCLLDNFSLQDIPGADLTEGLSAIFAFSYELKAPAGAEADEDGSRLTQVYRMLGCSMRSLGDPGSRARLTDAQLVLWQGVVELFRPLQWRLDRMLLALPHQPRVVYRGIDVRVADNYTIGSIVFWPPVTSTSITREVAWEFMSVGGAGTFWIVLAHSVAEIAAFSWLPGEDEWLLHSLSMHLVSHKVHPGLRAMLHTNHDIVALVQCDGRLGRRLTPQQTVDARQMVLVEQTRLFDEYLATYVPPEVRVGRTEQGAAQAGPPRELVATVSAWAASSQRTALLMGDSGCGKTTTALEIVRMAASRDDPLPHFPGQQGPWVPIYIPLPTVAHLLAPGTGCRHPVRPVTEYILASTHLNPRAEAAELKRRPVLLVLDGLEETPCDLARLRNLGLLIAGGLDLREWRQARVIVCVRSSILDDERGACCRRWRLREQDVLPDSALWYLQNFGQREVGEFCRRAVRRELVGFAELIAATPPEEQDAAVEGSLALMRCAPPPLDDARDLALEILRLQSAGAASAVMDAVDSSPAGMACSSRMMAATAEVMHHVTATHAIKVPSAYKLAMYFEAGHALLGTDMSSAPMLSLYGAWAYAEVRRRLPRLDGLAAQCPVFAAMSGEERVQLVLDFCGRLACSSLLIDVTSSALLRATISCYGEVCHVPCVELSPLGREHNKTLLQGAPLRVEDSGDGYFSFMHASVHDYFIADRVRRCYAKHGGLGSGDAQRVAVVLSVGSANASVRAALTEALGESKVRGIIAKVYALQVLLILFLALVAFGFFFQVRSGEHWTRRVGRYSLVLTLVATALPRRTPAPGAHFLKRIEWQRAAFCVSLCAVTAARVAEASICLRGDPDDVMAFYPCQRAPLFSIVIFFWNVAVLFIMMEPQIPIGAWFGLCVWQWPRFAYYKHLEVAAWVVVLLWNIFDVGAALWWPDADRVLVLPVLWVLLVIFTIFRLRNVTDPLPARA